MVVDSRVLAMIKAKTVQFLTDTCMIEKQVASKDQYGSHSNTWQIIDTDVACRVILSTKRDNQAAAIGDQEALNETYSLIVSATTTLDVDQRITTSNGFVYNVISINETLTDKVFASAMLTRARTS